MRHIVTYVSVLLVVALLGAGCSGDEADDTTTTTAATATTSAAAGGTTAPEGGTEESTTTTVAVDEEVSFSIPAYEVVHRIEGDRGGTFVVLLDPATYTSLTDVDLQNVIEDVIDRFPPVYEVHVVDDISAADLVLADGVQPEQQVILDEHYLVRLEEAFTIVYVGPFSDFPVTIIAS
jgi:hypothetical protein